MHWDSLYACDFFSAKVLGLRGTVRHMVFFVIEIKTRAVEIVGTAVGPDGKWMQQMALWQGRLSLTPRRNLKFLLP